MKDVEIDQAIRSDPKLLAAVEHATFLLQEVIGPKAGLVSAFWEIVDKVDLLATEHYSPFIRLRISDWTGSAKIQFPKAEFCHFQDAWLRRVFLRLLGDVLQERSQKQLESLNRMFQGSIDE